MLPRVLAFLVHVMLGSTACAQPPMLLVEAGMPRCVVVLSGGASPSERWAAAELVTHVEKMSRARLELQVQAAALPESAILIGDSLAVRSLGVDVAAENLGTDGFVLKTVGNHLVIAGGRQRGTMYGVFTLLERLGCRWWYPGACTIPDKPTITMASVNERHVPVLEYRDFLYGEMDDAGRLDRGRLHRLLSVPTGPACRCD